jgi:hypothetical protein
MMIVLINNFSLGNVRDSKALQRINTDLPQWQALLHTLTILSQYHAYFYWTSHNNLLLTLPKELPKFTTHALFVQFIVI